jgi:hypothetical protein
MKRHRISRALLPAAGIAVLLSAAACGSGTDSATARGAGSTSSAISTGTTCADACTPSPSATTSTTDTTPATDPSASFATALPTPEDETPSGGIAVTDNQGFKFGVIIHSVKTATSCGSYIAPPGRTCVVATVAVTNLQTDRPAMFNSIYFYEPVLGFGYVSEYPLGTNPHPGIDSRGWACTNDSHFGPSCDGNLSLGAGETANVYLADFDIAETIDVAKIKYYITDYDLNGSPVPTHLLPGTG